MQSSHCDSSVAIFEMEISLQFETAPSSKHQKASAATLDYRVFFPCDMLDLTAVFPLEEKLTPVCKKLTDFFFLCVFEIVINIWNY